MPYVPVEVDRRKKGAQAKKIFIKVRVTEQEREQLHKIAQEKGLTISDWIRTRTFEG